MQGVAVMDIIHGVQQYPSQFIEICSEKLHMPFPA
jgi:hypothetical protein